MVYHPSAEGKITVFSRKQTTHVLAAPLLVCGAVFGLGLASCAPPPTDMPDLAFHRGQNALAMGRYDWARRYFEEDLESNPDRSESLRGLGLGWVSGYEGSVTRGIEALNAYLERVPDDAEIRLRLARSWWQLGEGPRALDLLEAAEDSARVNELRANALADTDPAAAERQVAAALASEPDSFSSLLLAARLAHRRGDNAQALARGEAATRADPLRNDAFYLLARIRRGLGDEDGAQRDLETYQQLRQLPTRGIPSKLSAFEELQALRALEPRLETSALPWRRRLARLLLKTGDPGAEAAIDELMAADADISLDAMGFLELASEAHGRAQVKLARRLYQRALEVDPALKAARAQLARLEHETGDRDMAGQLLAAGIEANPHHAPYHFVSGLVALGQGDEPLATSAFETALDLVPWLPSYRLALADVYLAAGRRDDLKTLLEQAPAVDPTIAAYRRRHFG